MKRSPLTRKTRLARGTSGLSRTRTPKTRALKRAPLDSGLRQLVFVRAGGRCDCCARLLDPETWQFHHRKLRSRGGDDSLANAVALRPECHVPYVHGNPQEATERGLMVASWDDPATVPVQRGDGRLYLPEGRRWRLVTTQGV